VKALECSGNPISTIDVSENEILTGLSCGDMGLTTLDLTKNLLLTNLLCVRNRISGYSADAFFAQGMCLDDAVSTRKNSG
jgi:hypothetical protein